MKNFIYLAAHRGYVLTLYRHTLRNAAANCSSIHLRSRVRKVVKDVLFKHRFDKSSWSVHRLLEQMVKLNEYMKKGEMKQVWSLLTPYTKQKKPIKDSPVTRQLKLLSVKECNNNDQSPTEQREMQILSEYIKRNQRRGRLPHHISNEYKLKLLLPLALHERDVLKLSRIQHQLSKGPPKSTLTFTSAGSGKIWFVRSAVNKAKNQSKGLGVFIRQEKKRAQKRLNGWEACRINANWALHEAIWEQALEDGTLLKFSPEEYLHILSGSLEDDKTPAKRQPEKNCPPKVFEWLNPINEVMASLRKKNSDASLSYRVHREENLLNNGEFDYYQSQNQKVYTNRVKRFENLVRTKLPYVVPFIPGRDLRSILAKYRL